jgi:hypothetical protein
MRTGKTCDFAIRLEGVRERFERWRRTHRARSRIPDSLWAAAVRAAGTCGIHRTSKALRLSYYALKDRVEEQSRAASERVERPAADQRFTSVPAFLEVTPAADRGLAAVPFGRCECTLELEDADGAKMRVHLNSAEPPDLAALSRSFWNPGP